jgi:TRAP transporter TAXI family solute receptor
MVRVVNKYAGGITLTHVETGATFDNLRRVMSGQLEMGTVSGHSGVTECYLGVGGFTTPYPKLRLFEVAFNAFYPVAIRAELPINKVEDLAGYKFGIGAAGSDCNVQMTRTFKALGIDIKNYPGSYTEIVSAIKDRRIAGYAKSTRSMTALDSTHLDLMAFMKLRFLTFTEQQKNTVQAKEPLVPWAYIQAGQVRELPDMPGYWCPNVIAVTFGTSDISQDAGYRMAKAVFEHTDEINSAYPMHAEVGAPADCLKVYANLMQCPPLHAGFVQYFKEKGLDIPARLIPPEYKG